MADSVVVREVISTTLTNVTEADEALSAEYNSVMMEGLKILRWYLKYGDDKARLSLIRAMIPTMSRVATLDSKSEITASRTELLGAIHKMRPEDTALSTPAFSYDPDTHPPIESPVEAVARDAHHQDDLS